MKMNKSRQAGWLVLAMLTFSAGTTMGQQLDRKWVIQLNDFFRDGTKPVYLYAHERDGEWVAVVAVRAIPIDKAARPTTGVGTTATCPACRSRTAR